MGKKLDKFIDEVVTNIRKDREVTEDLLKDAIGYLAKDEARHRDIGMVLSKYVETLQRSNEQLVKITSLIAKEETADGLTAKDMEQIYSAIKEEE
tara:strand:- start:80 stop:364 length:285 start_codon:yes stop_codon:yes gene_type:complete